MSAQERLKFFTTFIGKPFPEHTPRVTSWLNGIIRAVELGSFTVEYIVREDMTNPLGILHGGISALIIDDLIGMTVYALGRETIFVSINLTVDFLGKARLGDKIIARSRVVRQGNQIINIECEILNAQGNLIARGTSNMLSNIARYSPRDTLIMKDNMG
ncbi:MAG: PaaI family thioesterase [Acidobacteriota bacterium]